MANPSKQDYASEPKELPLTTRAKQLLAEFSDSYDAEYGVGSMSCTIYDTAWVSMVKRQQDGAPTWFSPASFLYIIGKQLGDGSWPCYGAQIDGILNTGASLLALHHHNREPLQISKPGPEALSPRIERAENALSRLLQQWSVETTKHVGFEILVPSLLKLLAQQGFHFSFGGQHNLSKLYDAKMSKFQPAWLYGRKKLTALHSLEAFVGRVDFNRLSHHKAMGSMMASPSSTAAYLMNIDEWDPEAEEYLNNVIQKGPGKGDGGVPSAYPSTYFECSWGLSNLLQHCFSEQELQGIPLQRMLGLLKDGIEAGDGLIGFARSLQPDADDTARSILTLGMCGHRIPLEAPVQEFDVGDHFCTYPGERDPSISANCNILMMLCQHAEAEKYSNQIERVSSFLTKSWWQKDGELEDKWNITPHYSVLLMFQALTSTLELWSSNKLPRISPELILEDIPLTLFQALRWTLNSQENAGTTANRESAETAAYTVLLLTHALRVSLFDPMESQIRSALEKAHSVLQSNTDNDTPNYLWIEKVTYSCRFVSETYKIAALKAYGLAHKVTNRVEASPISVSPRIKKFARFFGTLPLYRNCDSWSIEASLIEAKIFETKLRRVRLQVFPRNDMDDDKYFEYIPFTWVGANNRDSMWASNRLLYEMMVISFLNYQADEYMEAVAGKVFRQDLGALERLIDSICTEQQQSCPLNGSQDRKCATDGTSNPDKTAKVTGDKAPNVYANGNGSKADGHFAEEEEVRCTLTKFVGYIVTHLSVQAASSYDRENVIMELRTFLLAHVQQTRDNLARATAAEVTPAANALAWEGQFSHKRTYHSWVRNTGADHTSCPYSFAFFLCLVSYELRQSGPALFATAGQQARDCFASAQEKYFSQSLCQHLATLCRMHNDYGSVARDRAEENFNSIDFAEFPSSGAGRTLHNGVGGGSARDDEDLPDDTDRAKAELFALGEFERCVIDSAEAKLRGIAQGQDGEEGRRQTRVLDLLKLFRTVTDTYGEIYIARDIGSWTANGGKAGGLAASSVPGAAIAAESLKRQVQVV